MENIAVFSSDVVGHRSRDLRVGHVQRGYVRLRNADGSGAFPDFRELHLIAFNIRSFARHACKRTGSLISLLHLSVEQLNEGIGNANSHFSVPFVKGSK